MIFGADKSDRIDRAIHRDIIYTLRAWIASRFIVIKIFFHNIFYRLNLNVWFCSERRDS